VAEQHKQSKKPKFLSELKELQQAFASVQFRDELERARGRSKGIRTVPTPITVKKLLNIRFKIDGDKNHGRPHIHVDYGKNHHAASFAIDNGERLAGGLNRKYDRPAREWIERNKTKLLEAWKLVMESGNTDKIAAELRVAESTCCRVKQNSSGRHVTAGSHVLPVCNSTASRASCFDGYGCASMPSSIKPATGFISNASPTVSICPTTVSPSESSVFPSSADRKYTTSATLCAPHAYT
jgi:hypothetical protein